MNKKMILAIDVVVIVGTFILLGVAWHYYDGGQEVLLSPSSDAVAFAGVLFDFSGGVEKIDVYLESLNSEPIDEVAVYDGATIVLEPGIYYLKIPREGFSDARRFDVNVRTVLKVVALDGERFGVVNAGEDLRVDVFDGQGGFRESVTFSGGGGG